MLWRLTMLKSCGSCCFYFIVAVGIIFHIAWIHEQPWTPIVQTRWKILFLKANFVNPVSKLPFWRKKKIASLLWNADSKKQLLASFLGQREEFFLIFISAVIIGFDLNKHSSVNVWQVEVRKVKTSLSKVVSFWLILPF